MKQRSNKRRLRYATVSLMLCVLVITSLIIINVIAAVLSMRYEWMYPELSRPAVYELSDGCREYISEHVMPEIEKKDGEKIKIIFCNTKEKLRSEELFKYVYDSFFDVAELFSGKIEIEHLDILEQPSVAQKYGVDSVTDVDCAFGDRYEMLDLRDFYSYKTVDGQSVATAYNGEALIASCLMRVTQEKVPVCYFTVNHGEEFADYELVKAISQSGYTVGFLDLYADEIPNDCELLVTLNPKKDLAIGTDTSSVSETERLDEYMSSGGKYMVFLSADTFASGGFENMETFLASWGVDYMHKRTDAGVEACYLVKDSASSLTVDGYTVLARLFESDNGDGIIDVSGAPCAFGNTTYMSVSEGFSPDGDGRFVSKETKRSLIPLFSAYSTAVAWADGRPVARAAEEDFILMSLTEEDCGGGKKAHLVASASVDFASEYAMQSVSLGNSRAISELIRYMGKDNAPSGLVPKPMGQTEIQSLTSQNANIITTVLVALPAVLITTTGVVVLVRRKNR